ncbi:ATP-binding protein [Desulfobulbus sp.]|uniref:ATP-binding protein n=1 Tax=Desulfobulbus sp. TaxID=895 RepID=UPI00286F8497|nr:ATP-binding protein [Desulfobulbus sp.]
MPSFLFGSIRKTLIVLVLLAVLPALAILLYTGRELRRQVVQEEEGYALRQVQAMAAHHERVVDNARLLLMSLAKSSEIRNLDIAACRTLLPEILASNTAYVSFSLANADGRVLVAAPEGADTSISASPFFRAAMDSGSFIVGNYTFVQAKRRVVVHFVQPVVGPDDRIVGVLVADFDLSYFGRIFYDTHLPEGSVFTLTDAKGMRLTRFPETEKYTWVRDLPQMVARMSGHEEEGTFLETGVDGVRRLYSFKRLHFQGASFPYLMIRLGIPVELALSEARAVINRNVGLLALATVLALVTAWFVGEVTMMRRLNRLIEATGKVKAGDLSSRIGDEAGSGELGQLGSAFDSMAEELERKERDRSLAEEQLRSLNEELEERVAKRTEELAGANRNLQQTLDDLQRMQKQLVLSEKLAALGELVAGVAHEINTPVGVALSAGSTMAEKNRNLAGLFAQGEMKRSDLTQFLEDSREGTEMILMNLDRASNLIRSFKMVAADQVSEQRRVFGVKKYIEELLLSLRPKLKSLNPRVDVVCDENLMVESYPGAFSQILTNLIVNTLTHGFDPAQAGTIQIEVRRTDGNLELRYADNGKGMPAEIRDRIFEPFFTTARGQGSTGLGMHIVFNIVTRTLGGTITCESTPGQGTVFVMTMPV